MLRTGRAGFGRQAGHDLTIEATDWTGRAVVDVADPAASTVTVEVPVDGLEVREGTGGVMPLGDSDKIDIKKNLRKILQAERHPSITFRSTKVTGTAEAFTVEGELTIAGTTRTATVQGRLEDSHVTGSASVVQSRWGIKPYSAFFGALKLADEVKVTFELTLSEA